MARKSMELEIPSMESLNTAQRAVSSILNDKMFEHLYVNLDNIQLNPDNIEFNTEDTEEEIIALADNIEKNGMLHNIVLSQKENGSYLMLSGERRYKAHQYLVSIGKSDYNKIYSQVRTNLNKNEENILLLSANVNARGGGSTDETKRRKSAHKLVSLIEDMYGITTKEAISIVTKQTNMDKQTLDININIERNLIPELKELFNRGVFNKEKAREYVTLSEDIQKTIYSAIKMTIEEAENNPESEIFSTAFKNLNDKVQNSSKKIKDYESLLEKRNKILERKTLEYDKLKVDINKKVEELNNELKNSIDKDETKKLKEELKETKDSLKEKEKTLLDKINKLTEDNKIKEKELETIRNNFTNELIQIPVINNFSQKEEIKNDIFNKVTKVDNLISELIEEKNIQNIQNLKDPETNEKIKQLIFKLNKLRKII